MFNVEEFVKCIEENGYRMVAGSEIQDQIENVRAALNQSELAATAKAWFHGATDSAMLWVLCELRKDISCRITDELIFGLLLADGYISFEQAKTYIEHCFREYLKDRLDRGALVNRAMVIFWVAKYYELKDVAEVLRMFKPEILDEVMRCSLKSDYRLLDKVRATFKYCGLDGHYHEFISSKTVNLLLDTKRQEMYNDFYDDSGDD